MSYPLGNALYQWEDGYDRLHEQANGPMGPRVLRAADAIRDELRRRIGATFTASQLAELYAEGTDWCLEAARWAMPEDAVDLDPQAIVDGAFYEHLRGATDFRGGRLVAQE